MREPYEEYFSAVYSMLLFFVHVYYYISEQGNGNRNYQIAKQQFSNNNHLHR